MTNYFSVFWLPLGFFSLFVLTFSTLRVRANVFTLTRVSARVGEDEEGVKWVAGWLELLWFPKPCVTANFPCLAKLGKVVEGWGRKKKQGGKGDTKLAPQKHVSPLKTEKLGTTSAREFIVCLFLSLVCIHACVLVSWSCYDDECLKWLASCSPPADLAVDGVGVCGHLVALHLRVRVGNLRPRHPHVAQHAAHHVCQVVVHAQPSHLLPHQPTLPSHLPRHLQPPAKDPALPQPHQVCGHRSATIAASRWLDT